jgi:flagellar FliL protein
MSSAAEEKTEASSGGASAGGGHSAGGSGKGNSLVLILTAVNSLVTIAMIGILLVNFKNAAKKPKVEDITTQDASAKKEGEKGKEAKEGKEGAEKKQADFGKMVTLDQFTVNLSTPGSATPKFVRVNVSLEVPNDDIENEVNFKMPQVRNVIIDLFNSKRPADLSTADGRDYLKEEIKNALNGFLVRGKVQGVFFTNFAFSG